MVLGARDDRYVRQTDCPAHPTPEEMAARGQGQVTPEGGHSGLDPQFPKFISKDGHVVRRALVPVPQGGTVYTLTVVVAIKVAFGKSFAVHQKTLRNRMSVA